TPSGQCLVWAKSRHFAAQSGMSALGQKRTHALQQKESLFDQLGVSRQPELEHGTFRYARQSPDLPAVRLNNCSANGQPDSHAIRLGRVEGVKKAVKRKSLQPRT